VARKTTRDAVEILHKRLYADNRRRFTGLEKLAPASMSLGRSTLYERVPVSLRQSLPS
jgi:hypothetical protein